MIVTMAYDEDLGNRIRELIASEDGYLSTKRELEPWVMESVAFARALPPKKK